LNPATLGSTQNLACEAGRNSSRGKAFFLCQRANRAPLTDEWLGIDELSVQAGLHFPKRRADWRLGRWTAKLAVARLLGYSQSRPALARLQILAAGDGAPELWMDGARVDLSLSLSHGGGEALCALSREGAIGCDVERIDPRSPEFVADYFTDAERAWFAHVAPARRNLAVNLIWSAKESALKALRVGLRRDTREIQIEPPDWDGSDWRAFQARDLTDGQSFAGCWRPRGDRVQTQALAGADVIASADLRALKSGAPPR